MKTPIETVLKWAWQSANDSQTDDVQRYLSALGDYMIQQKIGDAHEFLSQSDCGFKDRLAAVSQYYGFDWRSADNGWWYYPLSGEVKSPPQYIPPLKVVETGEDK